MSERRCSNCSSFHSTPFSVCEGCRDIVYKAVGRWCDVHGPTFGRCAVCDSAPPTPFGKERAETIWAERLPMHDVEHAMTAGEISYVTSILRTKPGDWCWMNVFYEILSGRITS
jgi:hypothetical protein